MIPPNQRKQTTNHRLRGDGLSCSVGWVALVKPGRRRALGGRPCGGGIAMNLVLTAMAVSIWLLMHHHSLFAQAP
jgi:hypothetical protein